MNVDATGTNSNATLKRNINRARFAKWFNRLIIINIIEIIIFLFINYLLPIIDKSASQAFSIFIEFPLQLIIFLPVPLGFLSGPFGSVFSVIGFTKNKEYEISILKSAFLLTTSILVIWMWYGHLIR